MPGGIERSNLDKVFWPDVGLTKGDLIAYFEAISPHLLPVLRDRPLTVIRYPDGIAGFSFYQKNTPSYAPPWVSTIPLRAESAGRTVRYVVCNSKRTLIWLANQAAIELHPWLSRRGRLDRPDHLVLDLDPPAGAYDLAVEVAFVARGVLREAGLSALVKTSGAKGLHLYVPIRRSHHYGQVRGAAATVAQQIVSRADDVATTEFKKAARGHRIFVDIGRNAPGAHIVAPYSPRAGPGAPVSFPVPWRDLRRVTPADFTLTSVPGLIRRHGDRWRELMPRLQTLPRSLVEASAGYHGGTRV